MLHKTRRQQMHAGESCCLGSGSIPVHYGGTISSHSYSKGLYLRWRGFLLICLCAAGWTSYGLTSRIDNTAQVNYTVGANSPKTSYSNTVSLFVRTSSQIDLLQYAPSSEQALIYELQESRFDHGGDGTYIPLPVPAEKGSPLDLNQPIPLMESDLYQVSQVLFVRVRDIDQNRDIAVRDSVIAQISIPQTQDVEMLELIETGLNTAEFIGYIQLSASPSEAYNGILSVNSETELVASYTDGEDRTDSSTAVALIDPFGRVFDSNTGELINGAVVTLIDVDTGREAVVYGDDGISRYPASVMTGGAVTDSSGNFYNLPPGGFRFPYVNTGDYQLKVEPPSGYAVPSTVSDDLLRNLPGGPYAIVQGSKGEIFRLNPGPALHVDIPVDPVTIGNSSLYIRKTSNTSTVGIGEFLRYEILIENSSFAPVTDLNLTDILPYGFRYEKGSTQLDGVKTGDPNIAVDGRSLAFSLGMLDAGKRIRLLYVAEVTAAAEPGEAVNSAVASATGVPPSNTAYATVLVQNDLQWKTVLAGQVYLHEKENGTAAATEQRKRGVAGVRIYLEDGTYVLTDDNGLFHFEGLTPGTHVVQLDVDSLPERYEPIPASNSRFAGRAYSRFVDVQHGALWRVDFRLREKSPPEGYINLDIEGNREDHSYLGRVTIQGGVVPVENLRLTLLLPPELKVQDPLVANEQSTAVETGDGYIVYRLGSGIGQWHKTVEFRGNIARPLTTEAKLKCILLFDTPAQTNQRLPLAELGLKHRGRNQANSSTELEGLWDSNAKPSKAAEMEEDVPLYNKEWLQTAETGFEWLEPAEGFLPAIPSLKVVIKHNLQDKLSLLLNGEKVSPLNFEKMVKDKRRKLAVSHWRGIDLKTGDNQLEVLLYDSSGEVVDRAKRTVHYSGQPFKSEFLPEFSTLTADGRTVPMLAVRLTDEDGYPARRGVVGEYEVQPPYRAYRDPEIVKQLELANERLRLPRYTVGEDGVALLRLEPTTTTGEVIVNLTLKEGQEEVTAWLEPGVRDWILVGLAEGTAGYNTLQAHLENAANDKQEEHMYHDGRVAFFAKGKIKGKWLLTLAYDSEKKELEEKIFQTIDPDRYYSVYGDETQQMYEAESTENLYVKLEREAFYALFGDYETGLILNELARYNRSLTGFKTEYRGKVFDLKAFASETNQAFVKDEIRGNGTSGLYRLSRENLIINSEKIVIEVRDRFHSERILSSQSLIRHLDYNIDYEDGTIYFKRPIHSRDKNLNPVYIVIDYEAHDSADNDYVYGGRGAMKILEDKMEIGATHVHEGSVGGDSDLYGADVRVELTPQTEIRAELARTESDIAGVKKQGEGFLAEVKHRSAKFDGTAYVREQDEGFGVGQQRGTESGTRKLGAAGNYYVTDHITLESEIYRHYNLATDAERDVLQADFLHHTEQLSLRLGYLYAEDRLEDGSHFTSNEIHTGIGYSAFNQKLILRADRYQAFGNSNENNAYPTRTVLGADYLLNDQITVFTEYEMTSGDEQQAQTARAGIDTRPWTGGSIHAWVADEVDEADSRSYANFGLAQDWQINPIWSVDGSVDYSRTLTSSTSVAEFDLDTPPVSGDREDFAAFSLGATRRVEKWTASTRIEHRSAETEDKWSLFAGVLGEVQPGLSLSASALIFDTQNDGTGDEFSADLRLGLAYRPLDSKWMVLDRLDLILDEEDAGTDDFRSWRIVNHLDSNWQPDPKTQVAFRYACKFVAQTFDSEQYSGYTDLTGIEIRRDITKRWDMGIRASVLHSWDTGVVDYAFGPSIGFSPKTNMWISVGYNLAGFYEKDFSSTHYTMQGPYVKFRLKFDQDTAKTLKNWLNWR